MKTLNNKKVVVTGALGTLGREVCSVAESCGATVIRLDISGAEGTENSHAVDLSDLSATQKCFDSINEFDTLVNVAGGFAMGANSWQLSDEQWDMMFKLNVTTMRNSIKAAVPILLAQNVGGSIINVGAYGALSGQGMMGAYSASKSVVMRLTETLAEELKNKGINVNAVLPTVIDTPDNRAAMPDANPTDWVSPTDLAKVICFLASSDAKAINGALLPVRGLS